MGHGLVIEANKLDHPVASAGDGLHSIPPGAEALVRSLLDRCEAEAFSIDTQIRKKITHFVLMRSDTISPLPAVKVALFFESLSPPNDFSSRVMRETEAVFSGTVMVTSKPSGVGL